MFSILWRVLLFIVITGAGLVAVEASLVLLNQPSDVIVLLGVLLLATSVLFYGGALWYIYVKPLLRSLLS